MSIASRIIILFLSLGLFLVSIVTGYITQRDYSAILDRLVANAVEKTYNRPDLEFAFYRLDRSSLEKLLGDFLNSGALTQATAYSGIGDELATREAVGATPDKSPPLSRIREGASVADTRLTALDGEWDATGTGFWSALIAADSQLYLSVPVFSSVIPTSRGLGLADFVVAQSAEKTGSLVVLGFVNLAIDRGILLLEIAPTATRILAGGLLLLVLCALPAYLYTRQLTAPMSRINLAASQFLSGHPDKTFEADEKGEFREIAQVLNSAVKRYDVRKEEAGLEHKLLLLQSGERASRLEEKEEELTRATEEISATREELHRLANYDPLTSLPNRQLFTEQLGLLLRLCERSAKPVAVLLLNIDNFHRINDSLGRSAGETLLQEVGKRLVGCVRSSDVLAHNVEGPENLNVSRLSGDEFAVALGEIDSVDTAEMVAQRVVEQLMKPMTIDKHELVLVPKIGISVAPRHGTEAEELLRFATAAMHNSKSSRGGTYLLYQDDGAEDTGQDDLKMEAELRRSVEREQLSLHYQPQVDTTTGAIVCAETFLRWEHPEFGEVPPSQFIRLAEESGQIWELGDWSITEACRQISEFEREGIRLPRMSVNISPEQIQPAFVARLREILAETGVDASKLELGLSEAILMNNDKTMLGFMQELKELGVYLSLENFGASHAPISYLSRYPIDEIKIDHSFIADCDKQAGAARLVKAIIAMSESLGLPTVAEGVETEGEFRFLSDHGVMKMRGYLFSRPVSAAELQEMLAVPWHYMDQIRNMALLAELAAPGTR